jgi:hypothetical protein
MIAVGLPLAREDDELRDEDSLDRESHDDYGDDGRPEDSLTRIYHALRNDDEQVAEAALALAKCLQKMAHARDDEELKHWYERACGLADAIDVEDDEGERNEQ